MSDIERDTQIRTTNPEAQDNPEKSLYSPIIQFFRNTTDMSLKHFSNGIIDKKTFSSILGIILDESKIAEGLYSKKDLKIIGGIQSEIRGYLFDLGNTGQIIKRENDSELQKRINRRVV